jgi:hypothetical protein
MINNDRKRMKDSQESDRNQRSLNANSTPKVSFERRSFYAYSIASANTNRIRKTNWVSLRLCFPVNAVKVEPIVVPDVAVFAKIMTFLSPQDAVKLLRLCQLWSGPAAEAFYASLVLSSAQSFPALVLLLANQDTIHPYSLVIRELCFTGEAAQEVEMGDLKQALQSCTNLVSLRIEGCSHLSSQLAQFLKEHAPFLSRVEFPACHVSDSFLQHLIRGVWNLKHIDVSYTSVSLSQLALMVRECPSLETLCMAGCQQSPEGDVLDYEASEYHLVGDSLKKHINCSLKEVDISNSLINDAIIGYLARHAQNLESVIMDGCSLISDNAVNLIAMHCPNIKLLNLSYCHITDVALQSLAIHLSSNTDDIIVAERTKSYSSFSEYQPSQPTEKKTGPLLERIVLTGCKHVTQAGLVFLASKCPRLETIVLDGCHKVTDWYLGEDSANGSPSTSLDSTAVTGSAEERSNMPGSDTESFLSVISELDVSCLDQALRKLSLNRKQVLEKEKLPLISI